MLKTPCVKKPGINADVEARILGTNGPEWLLEAAWICKVKSQQLYKLLITNGSIRTRIQTGYRRC